MEGIEAVMARRRRRKSVSAAKNKHNNRETVGRDVLRAVRADAV
jgi:hypothetical protein